MSERRVAETRRPRRPPADRDVTRSDGLLKVIIESVSPEIDGGRHPIKRRVGEQVEVQADIFTDGHDTLSAVLLYRQVPSGGTETGDRWLESPMTFFDNDRWTGTFAPDAPGRWQYTIEAWVNHFASWRADMVKRVAASQVGHGDLVEGALLVRAAARRAEASDAVSSAWLDAQAETLESDLDPNRRAQLGLGRDLLDAMNRSPDRANATRYPAALGVIADRDRASIGAWYEVFPRSGTPEPGRSATFREAEERLADIAAMGFDILYLPPIHPIGKTGRKGPGNTLSAAPGDPGSPWAIGSADGGHKAVEPGLGSLEDFERFQRAAHEAGMEIALDLAYQCSPDHPYVREHPEWFRHRPDGSIKYAENPPKKYQDIYPINFDTSDWRALWVELASVVEFWADHGVRIFRVDNPHTKPFRFWEWLIDRTSRSYPDLVFLAEAFTRPKVMRHLAKLGFNQSYTYFTWRNTKPELTEYLTELTQTGMKEYFRPNFFANTPDILHAYLQHGGRAAFQARLVLAATLGASYGIYSGFETCVNAAVPGTEEYHPSEKYEIFTQRPEKAEGHIRDLIRSVNAIRRAQPALRHVGNLRFHDADNPRIIAYTKGVGDNALLIIVNLNPHAIEHGWVRAPLADLGIPGASVYEVEDLLDSVRYTWTGERNYVRLAPAERVAHIFKARRSPGSAPGPVNGAP